MRRLEELEEVVEKKVEEEEEVEDLEEVEVFLEMDTVVGRWEVGRGLVRNRLLPMMEVLKGVEKLRFRKG